MACDLRSMQGVADPELVRTRGLEPAERLRRLPVRTGQQLQPLQVPMDGAVGRAPPEVLLQDPHHLRGRPRRVLPLQGRGQVQDLLRRARGDLAGRRQQRFQAALAPELEPAVHRPACDLDRLPERIRVHFSGDRPDHRPALPRRQGSVSRLTDQLVTEQSDLVGPLGPPSLLLIDQRHPKPSRDGCGHASRQDGTRPTAFVRVSSVLIVFVVRPAAGPAPAAARGWQPTPTTR